MNYKSIIIYCSRSKTAMIKRIYVISLHANCELDGQDALSMKKVRLTSLEKNEFTTFSSIHKWWGISDVRCEKWGWYSLKRDYPLIIIWHCLNHQLELAVSDAKSMDFIPCKFETSNMYRLTKEHYIQLKHRAITST